MRAVEARCDCARCGPVGSILLFHVPALVGAHGDAPPQRAHVREVELGLDQPVLAVPLRQHRPVRRGDERVPRERERELASPDDVLARAVARDDERLQLGRASEHERWRSFVAAASVLGAR